MNADRINELAALGAVGALEGNDALEWQSAVAAVDPATLAAIGRTRDAAALAALARVTPRPAPAALKTRVLAAVHKPAPRKGFYFIGQHEGKWIELMAGCAGEGTQRGPRGGPGDAPDRSRAGNTHYPIHHHHGGEECFVVSGDFHVEGRCLGRG